MATTASARTRTVVSRYTSGDWSHHGVIGGCREECVYRIDQLVAMDWNVAPSTWRMSVRALALRARGSVVKRSPAYFRNAPFSLLAAAGAMRSSDAASLVGFWRKARTLPRVTAPSDCASLHSASCSFRSALAGSCDTRDSFTPISAPISFIVASR